MNGVSVYLCEFSASMCQCVRAVLRVCVCVSVGFLWVGVCAVRLFVLFALRCLCVVVCSCVLVCVIV